MTEDKSECVSRQQRLNANDFKLVLAEDDTEKLGGYQGEIMSVSGARVIHCPSEADEHYCFFLPNAGSIRIIAATMKPGMVETRIQRKKPE